MVYQFEPDIIKARKKFNHWEINFEPESWSLKAEGEGQAQLTQLGAWEGNQLWRLQSLVGFPIAELANAAHPRSLPEAGGVAAAGFDPCSSFIGPEPGPAVLS